MLLFRTAGTTRHRLLHYGRDSPLRPELAESTLALYRATGKTKYLRAGKDLLRALHAKNRVACGYAALADVKSGRLDDRMDSFFISETLKYLFLLFDRFIFYDAETFFICAMIFMYFCYAFYACIGFYVLYPLSGRVFFCSVYAVVYRRTTCS